MELQSFIRLCILFDSIMDYAGDKLHSESLRSIMDYAGDKLHSESLQDFLSGDWVSEVIGAPQALTVHICRVKADRITGKL